MLRISTLCVALLFGAQLYGAEVPVILNDGAGEPLDFVLPADANIVRLREEPKRKSKFSINLFKKKSTPQEY